MNANIFIKKKNIKLNLKICCNIKSENKKYIEKTNMNFTFYNKKIEYKKTKKYGDVAIRNTIKNMNMNIL